MTDTNQEVFKIADNRPDDITAFEAGIALLGAGCELMRVREDALGITQAQTAARTGQTNEGAQSDAP